MQASNLKNYLVRMGAAVANNRQAVPATLLAFVLLLSATVLLWRSTTADTQKAWFTLGSGLLISLLFAAVVWLLSLNRLRARALVDANGGLQAQIAERTRLEGELARARDVAAAANQAKSDFLGSAERTGRPRVMVVDDSPLMLVLITELLQDECDLVTAADGELAWAQLQHTPIDAIVSDVLMPNLDGFSLTARVKSSASFSHVPVILLTARAGGDASATGLACGADDYIAKPFSPVELKARVNAVLRMGRVQAELRHRSRQAGMAEIATSVLHNVGNVLNSVNVSAGLVTSKVQASKVSGLSQAAKLMNEHAADLGDFLTQDAKGKLLLPYLGQLSQALEAEQQDVIEELRQLASSVDHIKEIVATQQSYARAAGVAEAVLICDLVNDALRMNASALEHHRVKVVKEVADLPMLPLDRHRVLLILVNLISNAKYALDGVIDRDHQLTLKVDAEQPRRLRIRVSDNGEGIAAKNLTRIFSHGFTTRQNGHGFGLHSCVLAAQEMGGTLCAHSDGPGLGATFTLELPINTGEGIR
jgi:two-component system sensor histidine kinase ChiS